MKHLTARTRQGWWLALVAIAVMAAACQTTGMRPVGEAAAPAATEVGSWEGVWVEYWPDTDEHDRFRISLLNDGYTIKVDPVTNTERQVLADLRWDGTTLFFTDYVDNRPLFYTLKLAADGDSLVGTVASSTGEIKEIEWRKEGAALPPRGGQRVDIQGETQRVRAADWAGNWEEQWPEREENDAYRIQVSTGSRMTIETLTNVETQQITSAKWNGRRLSFTLRFKQNTISYELFAVSRDQLVGIAVMPDESARRIEWNRIGPRRTAWHVSRGAWNGTWKEYWPGRGENDLYQIRATGGERPQVTPVTNPSRQGVESPRLEDGELSFILIFDQNQFVYALSLEDSNTVVGTVRLPDGQIQRLAWLRVGD